MGIAEVMSEPQEPLRAVEHVRRLAREHVAVWKEFLVVLGRCIDILRQEVRGELEFDGRFYPTTNHTLVRLDARAFKRNRRGIITHSQSCQVYFCCNEQGLITGILSSTVLPHGSGNRAV